MTTDNSPQFAVDIDMTRVSLVHNVRQLNFEQQVFPLQEDTGYVREFSASSTGLQHPANMSSFEALSNFAHKAGLGHFSSPAGLARHNQTGIYIRPKIIKIIGANELDLIQDHK